MPGLFNGSASHFLTCICARSDICGEYSEHTGEFSQRLLVSRKISSSKKNVDSVSCGFSQVTGTLIVKIGHC